MKYVVTLNNKNYEVEVEEGEARVLSVADAVAVTAVSAIPAAPVPVLAAAPAAPAPAQAGGDAIESPMPGTIIGVFKKPGDPVAAGEVVVVLEAMKMENEIVATRSGTVVQVLVAKGAAVQTGDPMLIIQ